MAKRRWTVVLVPHGSEPSRILEVSYGVLKMAAGGAGMALVAVLLVGYATISRSADLSRSSRLQHENARLARELGELHGRLSMLSDTMVRSSQRDARIRVHGRVTSFSNQHSEISNQQLSKAVVLETPVKGAPAQA